MTAKGGSHGGGAEVTEFGKSILTAYRDLEKKAYVSIADDLEKMTQLLGS